MNRFTIYMSAFEIGMQFTEAFIEEEKKRNYTTFDFLHFQVIKQKLLWDVKINITVILLMAVEASAVNKI